VSDESSERATPTAADAERLVLRGGGSAAFGFLIRFGARFLFLFLAARLFGAALFGAYSLAIAAVELAVAVGGLGMKRYLFHLLEHKGADRSAAHVVLDAAVLVTAASLSLAAAMMLAVLLLPAGLLAANSATAMLILAPMIAGQALIDLFLAATRWTHKMRYEVAARSLVEPYVGIAAAAAAFALGYDQTGLLISYWAGTLCALGYAIFGMRRCYGALGLRRYRLDRRRLAGIARAIAFPTATDLINGLFGRLDLYLVGIFLGEAPAGIYGMARQIRTPIRQVRQSFDGMLTPIVARTLAARGARDTGAATASASRLILAIQLPFLLTLIVIGQPLLEWLGPDFAAGYWPLVILAAAETIQAAFGVGELILFYRRPALGLWVILAAIAVNIAAGWLLIPYWGIEGAALAVLGAVAASALLRRLLLRASFGIVIPLSYCAGPLAAAAAALAAILLLHPLLPPSSPWLLYGVSLALGLGTYAALLTLWMRGAGNRLSLVNLQAD